LDWNAVIDPEDQVMRHRAFSFALLATGLFYAPVSAADLDRLAPGDRRYYEAIKPAESETRWRQIPWMQDLAAAVEQAKKEKRPVLIWVSGDEPLERC
jgi:hypothetical protein